MNRDFLDPNFFNKILLDGRSLPLEKYIINKMKLESIKTAKAFTAGVRFIYLYLFLEWCGVPGAIEQPYQSIIRNP